MAKTTNYQWDLPSPSGMQIAEIANIATTFVAIDLKVKSFETALSTHKHTFAELANTPTTLSGYGITDGMTAAEVAAVIKAAVDALLDGSGEALDTLKELATALGNDPNFAATVSTALGLRVRVDAASNFTLAQKAQGRANIEALGTVDKGAAGGVASLDSGGKVPSGQLPALTTTATVGAAMAGANGKATPADGDFFAGVEAGGSTMFKSTWANIKAALAAIFYSKTEVNNIVAGNMAGRAFPRLANGNIINLNWSGQGGQPTWLFGGADPSAINVYNPSNFSVNYANSAGTASNSNGLGGQTLAQLNAYANDRAYWRTQEYLLAENIPVGGYTIARPSGNETIGIGADRTGAQLYYSNSSAGSSGGQINYGTWRAVSGPISQTSAGLVKRIG